MQKKVLGAVAIIGLLASWGAVAAERRVVYPTGVFPDDVANVQAVVDELGQLGLDGIIILKAGNQAGTPTAFDFGTAEDPLARGSVVVRDDLQGAVEFGGERRHGAMTTIRGGFSTILMQRNNRIAIGNIRFEGAQESAIIIEAATGVEIADNVIVDTEGVEVVPGITISSAIDIRDPDRTDLITPLTGRITLERNVVHGSNATFAFGVRIEETDAVVTVKHNAVVDVHLGIRFIRYRKLVRATENHVVTSPEMEIGNGAGIDIECGIGAAARAVIEANTMEIPTPDRIIGIFLGGFSTEQFGATPNVECPAQNSVIADNEIVMTGDAAPERFGIRLFSTDGAVSRNRVIANRIRGTATFGITVVGFPEFGTGAFPTVLANNVFFGNKNLEATETDALFNESTRDNLYIGKIGEIVEDFGENNKIILR